MDLERAIRFLQEGTYQPGTMEYKWWEYWDRVLLDNTVAGGKYRLFSQQEGSPGKEKEDTNWQISNQVDNNERMAVMALCFYYIPLEIRTQAEYFKIVNLLKTGIYYLKVGGKTNFCEIKLHAAFQASMPLGVTGAAAGDQMFARSIVNGYYELPIEIPLSAGASISSGIDFPVATDADLDGDKIFVHLVGPRWHVS